MSDGFNVPGGDITLRTHGSPNREFRVHKLILSLASSVFRDMFDVPQPKPDAHAGSEADIEVVDMIDPPQALELVLKLIYPLPPPSVDSLDLLVESLVITDKYNIESARARLRLELHKFVDQAPLRVYAIASRFGFGEEAETASTLTIRTYLPALTDLPDDLKYIPATSYHKLVVLHEKRRKEIEDAIDGVLFEPACLECKVAKALAEPRMRTKLVRIICRGTQTTVVACIKELGIVCKATCLTKFIEGVVVKLGSENAVIRPTAPTY